MNTYPYIRFPLVGGLSGKAISYADANIAPMPLIAQPGMVHNGMPTADFGLMNGSCSYPDVCSYRRKFGLLIPSTNTSMEYELWKIIFQNQGASFLDGIGLHTANVMTPKPQLATTADLLQYKEQFLSGLKIAVDQVLLAQPQYLIMGMSLEHIIKGIEGVRQPLLEVERYSGLSCAGWHDAAHAALQKVNAKRIGMLTAFDATGNANAAQLFRDLGYEVVASFGFACANAMHIAHVPNWAKEKAITDYLATSDNRLDAIVQCGTNMSLMDVVESVEPKIGIPILGINAITFWYALRENGFLGALQGAGQILRDF